MAKRERKPSQPFDIVAGRNAVLTALTAGRREVASVVVDRHASGPVADDVRAAATRMAVRLTVAEGRDLDKLVNGDFHQGFAAYVEKSAPPTWEDVEVLAAERRPLLVLDHVEDPRNLGAIIRTAAAFGVGAILIPGRRQAPVTPVVAKTAEGGLEFVAVVTINNVHQTVRRLKDSGVWCFGLEADGDVQLGEFEFATGAAFVFGGEHTGLGKVVRRDCDAVIAIPLAPALPSLNVAASAAITLYEYRRQHGPP